MIGFFGPFPRIYLSTFVGVAAALTARVIPRGCIRIDSRSVCAFGTGERVAQIGWLEAGFPPYQSPPTAFPVCKIHYSVNVGWDDIQFDVDDWCLKGVNGQKVACCDKNKIYNGEILPNPYAIKGEGSTMTEGGHYTTWEKAFPTTLKSLKDSKTSMDTAPPYHDAFIYDSSSPTQQLQPSWDGINTGQQMEALADPSNTNIATAGSTLNLNNFLPLNPVVQPVVPELNLFAQNPNDIEAGNAPFLANNIQSPEFPAFEPEEAVAVEV
ncbi:hypothetical protein MMC22_008938 [Lobaria immixta]|nr:hypothetical protein [Lobaria immixta]